MVRHRIILIVSFVVLASVLIPVLVLHTKARLVGQGGLFGEHSGFEVTQDEALMVHNATDPDTRPEVVPKLIHQIFHNWDDPDNETIPADWDEMRQSIIDLNPDYEYKLWTESMSRQFIADEYDWFLGTYDGFPHAVQRVDSLRYFLMRHFGGIYMDLDNVCDIHSHLTLLFHVGTTDHFQGCKTSLDSLIYFPVWVTDGGEGALSNNILGAQPDHPFWVMVTENIQSYAHNYVLPYVTVSYATGQWFETLMWEKYHAEKEDHDRPLTRIMMQHGPDGPPSTIFTAGRGGSWHEWDNDMFMWMGSHIIQSIFAVVAVIALCGGFVFALVKGAQVLWNRRSWRYRPLGQAEADPEMVRAA